MSARPPIVRSLQVPGRVLRSLAARFPERYPILLDSAADGPLSRLSILGAAPAAALWQDREGRLGGLGMTPRGRGFLTSLESWWLEERTVARQSLPLPFCGGWLVFLSYELAGEVEPRLSLPPSDLPWRGFALRVPCAVVHDRGTDRVLAVAEAEASHELDRIEADARGVAALPEPPAAGRPRATIQEEDASVFLERVRRAQEYIRAGDIYQANLSRPWHVELESDAEVASLYEALCATNPAPFAARVQWQGVSILSSSPERLVNLTGGVVQTRPIAGTRPRSRLPGGDVAETSELAAHPKERAEHVMLVDLERNDLGRVCEAGSVHVDEMMSIESYAHVHHIVSNVSGRLRAGATPLDVVRAVFPGGTITGCPKVRCMEIIAELEGEGRGAYTGSLGFLGRDGTMDLNILIRTITLRGRHAVFRAGGGIVADSVPERELEETRAKARGLLTAFEPVSAGK